MRGGRGFDTALRAHSTGWARGLDRTDVSTWAIQAASAAFQGSPLSALSALFRVYRERAPVVTCMCMVFALMDVAGGEAADGIGTVPAGPSIYRLTGSSGSAQGQLTNSLHRVAWRHFVPPVAATSVARSGHQTPIAAFALLRKGKEQGGLVRGGRGFYTALRAYSTGWAWGMDRTVGSPGRIRPPGRRSGPLRC